MGVFTRISNIIKSNINDLLDRAEDPEKVIKQAIVEMNESLREAKVEVARSIRDKKKLEQKYTENLEQSNTWEKRALIALEKGEESLAREALKRKKNFESLAKSFKDQLDDQTNIVEKLKRSLEALDAKIEEAKRKKDLLIARKKRAVAKKKINETMSSVADNSVFNTFDRMEDKINELEAQADASVEMSEWEDGQSLDDRFDALETTDVDDELQALKAKLKKGRTGSAKTLR